jgi:DNA-directed RNA polymerase specialized sigma24 family protein
MDVDERRQPGGIPTTHWSQVTRAGNGDGPALEDVLQRYQAPLKDHLRTHFQASMEDAEDWFQGFVQEKVLERSLLASADRGRGRFRTFLLNALERYVIQLRRKGSARKRRPEAGWITLDDLAGAEPGTSATGATAFDAAWGRAVVEEGLRRMEAECVAKARPEVWGVFQDRLAGPILHGDPVLPYPELVARFGLESPLQAANLLTTAKRMFLRLLEEVVGEYTRTSEETQAELRELEAILGQS